jgi:hypothetical protein
MKNFVELRHDRGFFVYAEPANGNCPLFFYLCYRAVDEHQAITSITPPVGCLSLAAKIAIHYCPACGANLLEYYCDQLDQFFDPTLVDFPA